MAAFLVCELLSHCDNDLIHISPTRDADGLRARLA